MIQPNSPIVIIGMHRSGTSMISRMLEKLGLFVGRNKDVNHEAAFFHELNDWLLCQSGGAWDNPAPIKYLLDHTTVRKLVVDYLKYMMKSPRAINFLGVSNYIKYRTPVNLGIPWGWKDPRNTYTLPLWLDIFPDAKVIHIYRHGVDVANSLKIRVQKRLDGAWALHNKRKRLKLYWLYSKRGGFADTMRCTSLEGGFSLWEEYLQQATNYRSSLIPSMDMIDVKYEEFLAEPYQQLHSLAQFCNLPANNNTEIANISENIRKNRAYAYRNDPKLQEFAEQMKERLAKWGY